MEEALSLKSLGKPNGLGLKTDISSHYQTHLLARCAGQRSQWVPLEFVIEHGPKRRDRSLADDASDPLA